MKSLIRWDPFRMMRGFDHWDELRSMQREMDRLFGRVLGEERETGLWMPSLESYVKDGVLHVKAELPGIDTKDLDVSVTGRELTIKGERKAEKDEKEKDYRYREISYGSFERRLALPEGVKTDELKASFVNGILEITVPVPAVTGVRRIEIETKGVKQIEPAKETKKAA